MVCTVHSVPLPKEMKSYQIKPLIKMVLLLHAGQTVLTFLIGYSPGNFGTQKKDNFLGFNHSDFKIDELLMLAFFNPLKSRPTI